MPSLASDLQARLLRLDQNHLRRNLRTVLALDPLPSSRLLTNVGPLTPFASNDYLGLSRHPAVLAAASQALLQFGAGATASRLITGSLAPHHLLEQDLATFKRTQAALSFSSGFAAAAGSIPALVGKDDFIAIDRLAHASLVDGARASHARLRVFRHNDPADLHRILRWIQNRRCPLPGSPPARVLIITEGVFSMDGDHAPLRDLALLAQSHDAWLMVDEAHATGLIGPGRRGVAEDQGVADQIPIAMGTLGKALGCCGGFIAGDSSLRDFLLHAARPFLFSTAPPPATAAAARAALHIVDSPEGATLAAQLHQRVRELHLGLRHLGWDLPPPAAAILPLPIGPENLAVRLAEALLDEGFWVPAIRFPTVARQRARLRFTLSAAHNPAEVQALLQALPRACERVGVRPTPLPPPDPE